MRPLSDFDVDFRAGPTIDLTALGRVRRVALTPLSHPLIQNDLDFTIPGKAIAKIRVKFWIIAGDDVHGAPHLPLVD